MTKVLITFYNVVQLHKPWVGSISPFCNFCRSLPFLLCGAGAKQYVRVVKDVKRKHCVTSLFTRSQLYRQVLLRAHISYGNSVCLSVCPSVRPSPYFGGSSRSRSSMLVPLESWSAVLVMTSSKSASICNRFHARWANSGKITISKGVPLLDALVRGESLHPVAPNYLVRNYRLYAIIWWRPGVSISPGFGSAPDRGRQTDERTDGQTGRIPIANTRLSSTGGTAVARKNRGK